MYCAREEEINLETSLYSPCALQGHMQMNTAARIATLHCSKSTRSLPPSFSSSFSSPFHTPSYLKCLLRSAPLFVVLTNNLIRHQRSVLDFLSFLFFPLCPGSFVMWCSSLWNSFIRMSWGAISAFHAKLSASAVMRQRGPCHAKRHPNILVTQEYSLTLLQCKIHKVWNKEALLCTILYVIKRHNIREIL